MDRNLFNALPDELDPMNALELEAARFRLSLETRRYGKAMTVVSVDGLPKEEVKSIATDLKNFLGTGGTSKEDVVELQGDHRRRVKAWLEKKGYEVEE